MVPVQEVLVFTVRMKHRLRATESPHEHKLPQSAQLGVETESQD